MKQFLITGLLLISLTAAAQRVELKPYGFANASDSTKSFVVVEVPNLKQADIYKKALTYLNSLYQNPSKVISVVDGESITVNGSTDQIKGSLSWYKYPFSYNIVLQFKDGKIRYEPKFVSLEEIWSNTKPPRKFYVASTDSKNKAELDCIYIERDNGSYILFKKELKESLENWANKYIQGIASKVAENW